MAAVATNPAAPEDGLLPASLFGSIFVSNSAHYVIAESRPERGERQIIYGTPLGQAGMSRAPLSRQRYVAAGKG
jgi:hypothetical protein